MLRVRILGVAAAYVMGLSLVDASAIEAMKPLDGYVCMGLKSDKEFNDWVPGSLPAPPGGPDSPPVFAAPTEGSRRLGYNYSPVIVKRPLNEVNGYVEIVRLSGERGWIKRDVLAPYGTVMRTDGSIVKTDRQCAPIIKANGKIGFHFSNG